MNYIEKTLFYRKVVKDLKRGDIVRREIVDRLNPHTIDRVINCNGKCLRPRSKPCGGKRFSVTDGSGKVAWCFCSDKVWKYLNGKDVYE